MLKRESPSQFAASASSESVLLRGTFRLIFEAFGCLQAHSCLRMPSKFAAPSTCWTVRTACAVARCFWRAPVAHLRVSELALDYPERMFFHLRIAQREPLPREVDAQHRLHGKRRATALSFRGVWRDQPNQRSSQYHTLHLRQELVLAFSRQVQAQVSLLHCMDSLSASRCQAHRRPICAGLLWFIGD